MLGSDIERPEVSKGGGLRAKLRPQARFGEQPAKPALSAEMSAGLSAPLVAFFGYFLGETRK